MTTRKIAGTIAAAALCATALAGISTGSASAATPTVTPADSCSSGLVYLAAPKTLILAKTVELRTGPSTSCPLTDNTSFNGAVTAYCQVVNDAGNEWVYVKAEDSLTGYAEDGWVYINNLVNPGSIHACS